MRISDDVVAGADHNRIHYLSAGPSDARHTLLYIPGWRVSALIWSKQLDFFSQKGYRLIAIDSRSRGDSASSSLAMHRTTVRRTLNKSSNG